MKIFEILKEFTAESAEDAEDKIILFPCEKQEN
jgi:hypothetical protein